MNAKYKKNLIDLGSKEIAVYATPNISSALEELKNDMTLYRGVRLAQVMEALYNQGHKDGSRETYEEIDQKIAEAKKVIVHRRPGRPKKKSTKT